MEITAKHIWWKQLERFRHLLYSCFFFFMPFTQALTFNVGFPLKISELALFLLLGFYIAFNKRVTLSTPIIVLISLLFFVITLSVLINIFWNYEYLLKDYETRFGYKGDSIARYVYFIMALLTFFISVDIYLENTLKYIRIWILGATVAASYAWYLVIFSFLKLPVFLLPGMENPPQTILGNVIRCGTFLEGNSMGLYLLISGGLAFFIKKFRIGVFLLGSVFTSFSTLAIVSVFIFLLLYFRNFLFRKKYIPHVLIGLLVFVPLFINFTKTDVYKLHVYDKIFGSTKEITNEAIYSKADRIYLIKTAYEIGVANPVLGVGLSNFARHYNHYFSLFSLDRPLYQALSRPNVKPIPNNIYAELWSESGALAFIVFCLLLFHLLVYTTVDRTKVLFPLLICIFFCFNAYPSFIMIYLWAFMALPVANYIKLKNTNVN